MEDDNGYDKSDSTTTAGVEESSATLAEAGDEALPTAAAIERKIVYTAEVELVVEQFDPVPDKVEELAGRYGGFIASSAVSGSPGSPRTGEWELRVPVERYRECLSATRELGEVHRVSVDSQDVTEEFYDSEARVRNKKVEEASLLELLEKTAGEMKDHLEVRRELADVREQIERVEGRLRVLRDLTSLTTIRLTVSEVKDYVPEEAASFGTRVRRGLQASVDALVATAQGLSIAAVAVAPWLAVLFVAGIVVWPFWRVARKRARRRKAQSANGPPM
jgi:hypothetical protein